MSALEDLLDNLDATRERTLVALEMLPDEALIAPGVIGRWSIADLLSILTAWDAEVVTGLLRLKQGKPPEKLLAAVANPDVYNARRYQDAQGRNLEVIFEDFQGARLHLEEWLSELSERALSDPRHYKSLGGQSLGRLIARATHEHEARYLPFLTTYADRRAAEEEEAVETIPLAGIDILDAIHDGGYADGLLSVNGHGLEETEDDDEFDD
jgi:hypothetical protein